MEIIWEYLTTYKTLPKLINDNCILKIRITTTHKWNGNEPSAHFPSSLENDNPQSFFPVYSVETLYF